MNSTYHMTNDRKIAELVKTMIPYCSFLASLAQLGNITLLLSTELTFHIESPQYSSLQPVSHLDNPTPLFVDKFLRVNKLDL